MESVAKGTANQGTCLVLNQAVIPLGWLLFTLTGSIIPGSSHMKTFPWPHTKELSAGNVRDGIWSLLPANMWTHFSYNTQRTLENEKQEKECVCPCLQCYNNQWWAKTPIFFSLCFWFDAEKSLSISRWNTQLATNFIFQLLFSIPKIRCEYWMGSNPAKVPISYTPILWQNVL